MARPRTPLLTVDCIVLDAKGRVLLIRRANPPFKGCHALPGGFVKEGETVEDACRRELLEETGVAAHRLSLVGVYSDPERDPRGHTVSAAFLARVKSARPAAGTDAALAEWVAHPTEVALAFDHSRILADALRLARKRRKPS